MATVAALEHFGRWRVDARANASSNAACHYLVRVVRTRPLPAAPEGWELLAEAKGPTDRVDVTLVYRRQASTR
jgi:hypothetical protein